MPISFTDEINVNVCKSDTCRNLARVDSPDYQSPTYHLGFPALHCNACGSNNYLLSNDDLKLLVLPELAKFYHRAKGACPHCFQDDKIQNGKTAKGTLRWKCKQCQHTFSINQPYLNQITKLKQLADLLFECNDFKTLANKLAISDTTFYRLLDQLALLVTDISQHHYLQKSIKAPLHIATHSFLLNCKNRAQPKQSAQLWGLTSNDSMSGYVLLNTLNYTQKPIEQVSFYQHKPQAIEHPPETERLSDKIKQRYHLFYQRSCFDQLVYTDSDVICKKGYLFQPVMAAHSHFLQLKNYCSSTTYYHYLEHEVLIRGACITAFGDHVHQGNCHIFYLTESQLSNEQTEWQLKARYYQGWWQNLWFEFMSTNSDCAKGLAVLTNKNKLNEALLRQLPATFKQNHAFHHLFARYFPAKRLATLQPETIQTLLTIFTAYFNYSTVDSDKKTAAQKAGLTNKCYRLSELIEQFRQEYGFIVI